MKDMRGERVTEEGQETTYRLITLQDRSATMHLIVPSHVDEIVIVVFAGIDFAHQSPLVILLLDCSESVTKPLMIAKTASSNP